MRRLLLAAVTAFAGSGISLAQSQGPIQQMKVTETDSPAVAKKLAVPELPPLERPVTPYWPNPLGPQQCASGGMLCGAPAKFSPGDGTEAVWGSIDYLVSWIKKGPMPATLVTTGGTTNLGVLGASDTRVIFGGSDFDYRTFSGARFTGGFWFDRGACWGLESSFFFTGYDPTHFSARSDANGAPVLARPITDVSAGQPTVVLISDPGVVAGSLTINSISNFYSWELNVVNSVARSGQNRFEFVGGFRSVHLNEKLDIIQDSALLPGGFAGFAGTSVNPPASVSILDRFVEQNDFYGPQVGARGEANNGIFFVNASFKVGVGVSHEESSIRGSTRQVPVSGAATQVPGGLLALATNSGTVRHNEFAVVPDFGLNVGWQINPLFRVYVGYNFLYWSDVVRPGNQISTAVNPNFVPVSQNFGQIGGPALPVQTFQRSDFWAQGVNFGVELRY